MLPVMRRLSYKGTELQSRLKDAVKLPEISPRSPRSQLEAVVGEAVQESRKRMTMKERQEMKREAMVRGYVGAMYTHSDLAAVQEEAMVALCHIIAKGDGIRTIVRTGGLESIVLGMRLHLGNGELQQRGASALSLVAAVSKEFRAAVVAAEGVSVLVEAARAHPKEPSVQERCCTALASVCGGDADCKAACVAAGAAATATAAMRAFLRRANLQARGCQLLMQLTAGDETCRREVRCV